ncbi:hypothetical protein QT397_14120 [Microbulbifer sp. MKSA007]|uniref:hypothetical protein n=1 Tax=unclassified Microbulbifer TaxID=2619833 RepID=UPI002B323319|nr:hypothetical protein QT397_14120 [Microbulbifer sp. MKSA007]
MTQPVVPENFNAWLYCITVECGIELTPEFVDERINALQDNKNYHTRNFILLYGQEHHQKVLSWFKQVREEI